MGDLDAMRPELLSLFSSLIHNESHLIWTLLFQKKMMNNATQNQKYLVAGAAAVAGMYMSYLYGQKNPARNVLDVPP